MISNAAHQRIATIADQARGWCGDAQEEDTDLIALCRAAKNWTPDGTIADRAFKALCERFPDLVELNKA